MARKDKQPSSTNDVLLYFIAIFIPPASVFIKRGCGADFWINLLLTILAWLPGLIHAWYIIAKYPDLDRRVVDGSSTSASTPYHQQIATPIPTGAAHAPAPAPAPSHPPTHGYPSAPPVYQAPAYQPPSHVKN
ncbi:hypothetical protein CF327_g1444 [Tilletia walkeri]|uniref:Plasma membrane proteolipid 3 n=1 Tax=Tilletia walkeri TaxID=117179 RepID=A0A8X7T711_9BASI|nr:hypothetical protein CF327_g1444 [Tilletia walkeri]KAE8231349.1 hypothetical protein CF326_g3642 [Tilletia indica]KAE8271226.1 hypothetical protein A4X09_0g1137 [Tilletia walkeri]